METYFAIGTRHNVAINRYKGAVSTKYRIWQVDKHMHDYGLILSYDIWYEQRTSTMAVYRLSVFTITL